MDGQPSSEELKPMRGGFAGLRTLRDRVDGGSNLGGMNARKGSAFGCSGNTGLEHTDRTDAHILEAAARHFRVEGVNGKKDRSG